MGKITGVRELSESLGKFSFGIKEKAFKNNTWRPDSIKIWLYEQVKGDDFMWSRCPVLEMQASQVREYDEDAWDQRIDDHITSWIESVYPKGVFAKRNREKLMKKQIMGEATVIFERDDHIAWYLLHWDGIANCFDYLRYACSGYGMASYHNENDSEIRNFIDLFS